MVMTFAVAFVVAVVFGVAILGIKVLNFVWLRPRKLEKQLRRQGFKGNTYRLLFGDAKEYLAMVKEAKSKPISLDQNIVPRVLPIHHKLLHTHGQNFFLWLGPQPMLTIMEPQLIKEILSKHNQFQKPRGGNPLIKLLVCGLVAHDNEKWVKHRTIVNPAFHIEKLKHMLPAFYVSCVEMIEKWEDILSKNEGSYEMNVWPDIQTLSVDVIARNVFGTSYQEGIRIFGLQMELAELVVDAIRSIYIPGSRFLPTKSNKRMMKIDKDVNASIRSIIDRRLKATKAAETSNAGDLLDLLLESNYKEIQQHNNDMKFGISIQDVIEECKVFYFAGHETTANLLVWTLILLSQHQYWQEQARVEVIHVFGDKQPDHDGLSRLKIVTMILNEVLRLYPPVVIIRRMTFEEIKVGDITLPAGVCIEVPIMMLHYDQGLWGYDANEFKPERFSEGVAKVTKGQPSFLPFGGGPRICIGQNFAMLEAKLVVAMILQRFSFTISTSYAHAPESIITLHPQHGAHLILRKI